MYHTTRRHWWDTLGFLIILAVIFSIEGVRRASPWKRYVWTSLLAAIVVAAIMLFVPRPS